MFFPSLFLLLTSHHLITFHSLLSTIPCTEEQQLFLPLYLSFASSYYLSFNPASSRHYLFIFHPPSSSSSLHLSSNLMFRYFTLSGTPTVFLLPFFPAFCSSISFILFSISSSLLHHFSLKVLSVIQGSSLEPLVFPDTGNTAKTSRHRITSILLRSLLFYPPIILSSLSLRQASSRLVFRNKQFSCCSVSVICLSLHHPLFFFSSLHPFPSLFILSSSIISPSFLHCHVFRDDTSSRRSVFNRRSLILYLSILSPSPLPSFLSSSFTSLSSTSPSHLSNLPHFKHVINKTKTYIIRSLARLKT